MPTEEELSVPKRPNCSEPRRSSPISPVAHSLPLRRCRMSLASHRVYIFAAGAGVREASNSPIVVCNAITILGRLRPATLYSPHSTESMNVGAERTIPRVEPASGSSPRTARGREHPPVAETLCRSSLCRAVSVWLSCCVHAAFVLAASRHPGEV